MTIALRSEANIARCRILLSIAAIIALFLDPTEPLLARWLPLSNGPFTIDPFVIVVLAAHLIFSTAVLLNVHSGWIATDRLAPTTIWVDMFFGAVIAFLTDGVTSPFYPFFCFAVVVAGFRSGRQALMVTAMSVLAYLALVVVSAPGNVNLYIMRPVYLAITGYLVGYLGQQCIELQQNLRQLETTEERHRIARDLHDGFIQALAAINLRLEGCRRSLLIGNSADALAELADLRASVAHEYDEVRRYMHSLAGTAGSSSILRPTPPTQLRFDAQVAGSIDLVDHILLIAREAVSNIRKHAEATAAQISVASFGDDIQINISDDGVGMPPNASPWSIVSRVHQLGGAIEIPRHQGTGARMSILLPS